MIGFGTDQLKCATVNQLQSTPPNQSTTASSPGCTFHCHIAAFHCEQQLEVGENDPALDELRADNAITQTLGTSDVLSGGEGGGGGGTSRYGLENTGSALDQSQPQAKYHQSERAASKDQESLAFFQVSNEHICTKKSARSQ